MARQTTHFSESTLDQARQLGVALRTRRTALGINVSAAAEAAGMSRVTWHRLENGEPMVGLSFLIAAANALGMKMDLLLKSVGTEADSEDLRASLPLQIELAKYHGLRALAWQVGDGVKTLSPREALGIYLRNIRHLDIEQVSPAERELMAALQQVFEESIPGV